MVERRRWHEWQPLRDVRQYVFLDECGVTTDLLRRYGRSPRGTRLRDHTPCSHWQTHTVVAARRLEGVGAPAVFDGPIDSASFLTKLKGPIPYLYYSLYVILDLFSRYVVGWMVAAHENAHLAQRLIEATCLTQRIGPHQLTIHADRGAPMRSKLVAELLSDLSIDARHSRPRVSNDNPFSEAQFRTFKYRPAFPDRFGSLDDARTIGHDLFAWYTDVHHHSGLSYLTPADVHYGRAPAILEVRHRARLAAHAAHPERFVQGPPRPETRPTAVWINPPAKMTRQDALGTPIVTPSDPQYGVIEGSHAIVGGRSISLVNSVESLQ